jgi:hypothetical protein
MLRRPHQISLAAVIASLVAAACGSFSGDDSPAAGDAGDPSSPDGGGNDGSDDRGGGEAGRPDAGPAKSFFVIGGQTATTESNKTYIGTIDTTGITWKEGPTLDIAQQAGCAATIDDRLFLIGGRAGPALVGALTLQPADPAAQWVGTSAPVDPRQGHACAATSSRIYVSGGGAAFSATQKQTTETALASGDGGLTWTSGPDLPAVTQDHASVALNGRVFVLGGYTCHAEVQAAAIAADGSLGAWSAAGALAEGRYGLAAAAFDDRIVVTGGLGGNACSAGSSSVDVLQIDAQGKVVGTSGERLLPDPRTYHGSAVVNGRLYVLGGNLGSGTIVPTRSVISAEIMTDKSLGPWRDEAGLPVALSRFALTVR